MMLTRPSGSTVMVTALFGLSPGPSATRTRFLTLLLAEGLSSEPHATSRARSWKLREGLCLVSLLAQHSNEERLDLRPDALDLAKPG